MCPSKSIWIWKERRKLKSMLMTLSFEKSYCTWKKNSSQLCKQKLNLQIIFAATKCSFHQNSIYSCISVLTSRPLIITIVVVCSVQQSWSTSMNLWNILSFRPGKMDVSSVIMTFVCSKFVVWIFRPAFTLCPLAEPVA